MNDLHSKKWNELTEKLAPVRAVRRLVVLAVLLGGWFAFPHGAVAGFSSPTTSPGGGDGIVVGDVNHDGLDDVAVLAGRKVMISLSDGTGAFRLAATLTGGNGSFFQVAILHVNLDGHPDVIAWEAKQDGWVTTGWGNRVRTYAIYRNVWAGRGDGTFDFVTSTTDGHGNAPPSLYNPMVAYADFNRDGITDSVGVDGINNVVYVALGGANGSYQASGTFPAGSSPGSVAVGDFNGDGWTDIVVVNKLSSKSNLTVLLNDNGW